MKIGKALRIERLNLKLTQEQMCKGIVSHPFYAKVESRGFYININGGVATCLNQIILGGEKAIPKN